jgi:hypothetical protein
VRRNGRSFPALGWDKAGLAGRIGRGDKVDLAFTLHVSRYLGEEEVGLAIEDIRP